VSGYEVSDTSLSRRGARDEASGTRCLGYEVSDTSLSGYEGLRGVWHLAGGRLAGLADRVVSLLEHERPRLRGVWHLAGGHLAGLADRVVSLPEHERA